MENLYGYGFWFNTYESIWYAIPRDKWTLFFTGKEDKHKIEGVYMSSEIDTLIAVINNPDLLEIEEWEEEDDITEYEDNTTSWPSANYHDNDDLPID
jgi:hypothetical protein